MDGIILFKSISDGFTPCFLLFYLLIPFLNKLISALTEKEHRLLLEWCLVVYTLIPSLGGWTAFNYITWFSVIYLVAAYLRLYPKNWFENGKLCAVAAAGTLLLSWLSVVGIAYFTSKTETGLVWPYYWVADSNKLLALATAVSAFLFFKNLKIGCSKGINTVAASAFGVLCIHANSDTMRQWLWRDTCNNLGAYQTSYAVIHAIGCVVVIYAVCTLLDGLRIRLLERPLLKSIRAQQPVVLLIDEVDKADEEFEAFLLELLSEQQVTVPEIGTIRAKTVPFVVLTSNRARPLSEALRRRCAYLHIDYPDMDKELAILRKKLPHVDDRLCAQVALAVQKLRSNEAILKKPSIAETLDWAAALDALGLRELTPDAMAQTAGFVLKNNEDMLLLSQQEQPGEHCGHCQGHSHG